MAQFEFKNFSAYYKQKKNYVVALDDITLDIKRGEFLVIVGPSGCGKTTLLKCCMGLCGLTKGTATLDGEKLTEIKPETKSMAYVSQEYSLYPQMTVYENIAFPLRMMHAKQEEIDERVKAIAKKLQLDLFLTRKPKQLSGGQHQRVAIARALIKNPRIILFDEPFSNLHPELRFEMREFVKQLHESERPTVIFVTHDLSEAFALAERIVVMNDGAIEFVGTAKELEEKPTTDFVKEFFAK